MYVRVASTCLPRTEIVGGPERLVKAGSTVVLRCIVRGALEPPTFIMWYHSTEQITGDSVRYRTQVDRNIPDIEGDSHSTTGSLIIESAKKRDNGNYTCSPSNSPSVTVMLNVINALLALLGQLYSGYSVSHAAYCSFVSSVHLQV
ncbi:unnamed protein product [Ceratitis capitata]|uniref:(Mediterranean fruit fly) hypothetical protein n=1 Tax=Ceratitis capitata TaxID=7213 RepID=A0A811TWB7_CERCA|nr:unnamed protein product [Ceratitis capitata]